MKASPAAVAEGPEPEAAAAGLKPLNLTLKLEHGHPYLEGRGVAPVLAARFGAGYCNRGMMRGRIAIPVHEAEGNLVGYLGRWPGNDPPAGEEKCKLPAGFRKSEVLFNFHRVKGSEHLVLVEGCFSVFRLHKLEVSAVALLGSALSARHEELLLASGAKRLTLLLDSDEAGRRASLEMLRGSRPSSSSGCSSSPKALNRTRCQRRT